MNPISQSNIDGDLYVSGAITAKYFTAPTNSITDASVQANAGIQASKVVHQIPLRYDQKAGVAATTETKVVHIANATGTVSGVKATVLVPPTSSDTITLNVQQSTGGGTFASILSAPIVFNSSSISKTVVIGALASASLVTNDLLQVVCTVVGSSGQAPFLEVIVRENPV